MRGHSEQLGPYHLLDLLGRGLQGSVYRARHASSPDDVAIKLLDVAEPGQRWQARREIHTLRAVEHPHIVRILDQDDGRDSPWYAMELIEGPDVVSHCRGELHAEPLPRGRLASAIRCFVTIARALGYLHGEGIVHRDLKPSNVLVVETGTEARPVILDLGLAHRLGAVHRERLTASNHSGTLAFMAPEQLRGETVDARADLFSLGALLYVALTGRLPFLTTGHILDPRQRPPLISELAPDLPDTLDGLVAGLLAHDRRDRPPGADLVAASLSACLDELGENEASETTPAYSAGRPVLFRPELVGRSGLADALAGRIGDTLGASSGGIITLDGPSGIGKTRLANEVAHRLARGGATILPGRCRKGGSPLAPLAALLDHASAALGNSSREPDEPLRRALERLAPFCRVLESWSSRRPERSPLPADEAQREVHHALWTLLEWLGDSGLVLAIDDLQWADGLTASWLDASIEAGWLHRQPLVVLATVKIDDDEPAPPLSARPEVRSLSLSPLESGEIGQLLAELLGAPAPARFLDHVVSVAGGSPLHVCEYARAAVQRGLLRRELNGATVRWRLAASSEAPPASSLPRSLDELLRDRLAQLPSNVLTAAEALSVLRPAAALPLLEEVAGLEPSAALEAAQDLLTAAIVIEDERGELRFEHQRVEDAAYGAIDDSRRRLLHGRAAAELERRLDEGQPIEPQQVALHWERANQPAAARPHYLTAARRAFASYALEQARELYEAYLRLADEPSRERAVARTELGRNVLQVLGETEDAEIALNAALDEAVNLEDDEVTGDVLFALGRLLRERGQVDEAEAAWERAQELVEGLGRAGALAAIAVQLGRLHLHRGDVEAARAATTRALELHQQLDDPAGEADAFINLAKLEQAVGRARGTELLELALRGYQLAGDRVQVARAHLLLGNTAYHGERWSEAGRHYEIAARVGHSIGHRAVYAASVANLGNLRRREGRYDEALKAFEQGARVNREIVNRPNLAIALTQLATIERRLGRLADAAAHLEESAALKKAMGDREGHARSLVELFWVCVVWGHVDQARSHLDRLRTELDPSWPYVEPRIKLAEGLLALTDGQIERATELLSDAVASLEDDAWVSTRCMTLAVLAQAYISAGALDSAHAVIVEAEQLVADHGDPFWGAQIDLGVSRWNRFGERAERARLHAERARRTFERIGAPLGLAVALCELGHIALIEGQSASDWLGRARAAATTGDLTPRSGAAGAIVRLERAELTAREGRRLIAGERPAEAPSTSIP